MRSLPAVHLSSFFITILLIAAARYLPPFSWAGMVVALSFLHFAASLQLFYRESGVIRRRPVLAVALPLGIFLGAVAAALYLRQSFAYLLILFFPLLLWHYGKQSYGVYVLSLRSRPGMDNPASAMRQASLGIFLLLATFAYLNSQTASMLSQFFGFYVPSLQLPNGPWVIALRALSLAGAVFLGLLALRARQYAAALTPLTFYLWCDYPLTSFALVTALPALHAVQYLPLAIERGVRGKGPFWFAVTLTIGAALLFATLKTSPRYLLGLGLTMAMAELTLNLHHYFIDAHIWRAREAGNRAALGLGDR